MTLTTIKNDIKVFGKNKLEYMRGYVSMQEDFQEKLRKQLIGKVYAEQELLKYKKEAESYSHNTAQSLYQQLENEKNIMRKMLNNSVVFRSYKSLNEFIIDNR